MRPEVARAEDDDVAAGDVVAPGLAAGLARRLLDRVADQRALLVAARVAGDVTARQRALHELVEAVAVTLLEGRALRLAVVGEHDDLVRAAARSARAFSIRANCWSSLRSASSVSARSSPE